MKKIFSITIIVLFVCGGCWSNLGPDAIEAPPVNAAITSAPGTSDTPMGVRCDGPEDEVAMLGALCGATFGDYELGYRGTTSDGFGMGLRLFAGTGGSLYLFAEAPAEDMSAVSYAAYVEPIRIPVRASDGAPEERWTDAELVTEGEVINETVTFAGCGSVGWVADATLLWRNTTISVRFSAHGPGC